MTHKILFLVAPLVISSIISFPSGPIEYRETAISLPLTLKPIDSSLLPQGNDYFSCTTFGPFSLSTVTNQESVTFTYELRSISSQNIVERVRLFNSSGTVVAAYSRSPLYYQKGKRISVSFTIFLKDYLTRNGLTLKFEIVRQSDYTVLKDYSSTFYPTSDALISWIDLKNNPHVSNPLGFYSDGEGMKSLIETLDFTHFGDYLDINYYYRLDINKNLIYYPNNCSFKYRDAYLRFNDNNYLFPYLSHQDTGDVHIPLKMVNSNGVISLKYKNSFYINKRTLQISDSYRSGFVSTKDFYLPINGRTKFNGKQLYFHLVGVGIDNITTTIPLKYAASTSIVGVCKDGDYCIIGGKR